MRTILSTIILACCYLLVNAQGGEKVKACNVTLIKGNYDVYGFKKEFQFINFQINNDSFVVRYINTADTIFWQTKLKPDSAERFLKKLLSFKLDKDYHSRVITDKTISGNTLSITMDKKTQKLSFTTPFTDSVSFKACVVWLQAYAIEHNVTKSKISFFDYLIKDFDTTQSNDYLSEIIPCIPFKDEQTLLLGLNKTDDWNIKHGILKALCKFLTINVQESLAKLLDKNIDKPIKSEMIVDALICENNDTYTKNVLIKTLKSKNRDTREKVAKYLAIEGVSEAKPEVMAYVHRTFSEKSTEIKANSYFEITSRIKDKELLLDLITLYQQNKTNGHTIVLKELMHAIECNIECYRNIHNEYVFDSFPFNFDVAMKRLDAKIETYLKN